MFLDIGSIREDNGLTGYVLKGRLIIYMQRRRTDDGNFFHEESSGGFLFYYMQKVRGKCREMCFWMQNNEKAADHADLIFNGYA